MTGRPDLGQEGISKYTDGPAAGGVSGICCRGQSFVFLVGSWPLLSAVPVEMVRWETITQTVVLCSCVYGS